MIQVGFVAGEMINPIRDLPRVLNSAMVIVIIGFVFVNGALYIALPIESIRERGTVAVVRLHQTLWKLAPWRD